MDYEEKYRKLVDAIKEMRDVNPSDEGLQNWISDNVPELAESEDERIRKAIIAIISNYVDNSNTFKPKMLAWLEKQGCQKSVDKEYTFKSIPRLLDMIEPTNRAKFYCRKLIESLQTEGYSTDAKIVSDCLKQMKGEKVAMATMDEQKSDCNEEDERIRKELIDAIQGLWDNDALPLPLSAKRKDAWLAWLEKQGEPVDKGEISDGFHTFNELYYYRMLYNAAFFNMLPKEWVHKSKKHNDGELCFGGGWFIVMANLPTGQISNHYELKDWDLFQIPEKERADKWDGHTPQEAAERLHKFLLENQESIDREKMLIGARKDVASSIITYLDRNTLGMCLSNMECEDLVNAVVDSDWGKVYDYMKKKLEKQGDKPQGKTALEAIKEEKVDNANKVVDFKAEDWYVSKVDGKIHNIYHSDKDEPKFHEGDWVVFIASGSVCQVEKKEKYYYTLRHILGDSMPLSFGSEHLIRLWTIEDAKEGDVLYYKGDNNIEYIVMNKGINMYGHIDSYFRYNSLDGFAVDVPGVLSAKNDNITPATEEQCDLLFSKMKEAGYEWDNDKKELKKIKSKFKGGDYIIHQGTGNIYQVISCIDNQYQLKYGDTYTIQKCDDVDRHARLLDVPKDVR